MRLLIDECLHISLTKVANEQGHECQHVIYCGLTSWQDHAIVHYAVSKDFVFVTNNAVDFRRLYGKEQLHPGLVIIVPMAPPATQRVLFLAALNAIGNDEPVNTMVEVDIASGRPQVSLFRWPPITHF